MWMANRVALALAHKSTKYLSYCGNFYSSKDSGKFLTCLAVEENEERRAFFFVRAIKSNWLLNEHVRTMTMTTTANYTSNEHLNSSCWDHREYGSVSKRFLWRNHFMKIPLWSLKQLQLHIVSPHVHTEQCEHSRDKNNRRDRVNSILRTAKNSLMLFQSEEN